MAGGKGIEDVGCSLEHSLEEMAEGKWQARCNKGKRSGSLTIALKSIKAGPAPPLVSIVPRHATGHPKRSPGRDAPRLPAWYGKPREEGWAVNFKRLHRFWKKAGPRVPAEVRQRRSSGSPKHGARRPQATRRNHVWSYDFIFGQTNDGRRLNRLPLVDEFPKENLAVVVDRRPISVRALRSGPWGVPEAEAVSFA